MSFEIPLTNPALEELSSRAIWVLHRTVNGKSKIPYSAITGGPTSASSKDKRHWTTFEKAAKEGVQENKGGPYDGMGFVLGDGVVGIDLDKCLNESWALEIIKQADSYTEITPSGNGYHILIFAEKNTTLCRKGKVEIYDKGRYFTVTGHHLEGTPDTINKKQSALDSIIKEYLEGDKIAGKTTDRDINIDGLVLDEPLNVVKFTTLLESDPVFKKTWDRNRKDFTDDNSLSVYDISLANKAIRAGWSINQIAALIREFRNRHGEPDDIDKFFKNDGYYPKYQIRGAIKGYEGKIPEKELIVKANYQGAQSEGQDSVLELLCEKLEMNLERIIKRGKTEDSTYWFVVDGREILIGSSMDLAKPSVVQSCLVDAIRKVIPKKTKREWPEIMLLFMDIIEEDDEFLLTRERQTKTLIAFYLEGNPIGTDKDKAVEHRQPFSHSGLIWISAIKLLKNVNVNKVFGNKGITQGELQKRLREIGWKPRRFTTWIEVDGNLRGKAIGRSAWGGKYDETFEETFGEISGE